MSQQAPDSLGRVRGDYVCPRKTGWIVDTESVTKYIRHLSIANISYYITSFLTLLGG